jgi:hypothetical protein
MLKWKRTIATILVLGATSVCGVGCMGDPDPSPVGIENMGGRIAVLAPTCPNEQVTGVTLEITYDQLKSANDDVHLWDVSDPIDPASKGPFALGDDAPWKVHSKELTTVPDVTVATVKTTRRHASSTINRSAALALKEGVILVNGKPGTLASLEKAWGC